MKFILLVTFLGFLMSCSSQSWLKRQPSSAMTVNKSCKTILLQLQSISQLSQRTEISIDARESLRDWLQAKTPMESSENYISLLKQKLTNDEISLVTKDLSEGESGKDRINYIIWSTGQLPKNRSRALSEIALWNQPEKSKQLKKFIKARKNFDKWEEKRFKKLAAEAGENPDTSSLRFEARRQRETYERLKYACSAKVPNSDNASAGKSFRRFIMTVGPVSVVAGYTVANWNELKSAWQQMQEGEGASLKAWFKQLGYDLSIGLILNYTLGRIFSEPTGTYLQKVAKGYGADLSVGLADMFVYNLVFPKDNNEVEARFNSLKSDPDFQQKMKILQKRLDDIGFVVKFKSSLTNMIKDMLRNGEELSLPEVGLMSVRPEDLDKPEVKKLVMKAIASQLYEEGRNGVEPPEWPATIIHTGEGGSDRLFFYAGVGPLYHLLNIRIGAKIYETICMGKGNLGSAFAKAAAMHLVWAFSYNMFEFPLRSHLIGQ